ncbi:Tripartite tricarboxylate transporter TctB family protein [Phaeobacter sp. CECT 5382]|uniref:tripartite tricarboxylate transporter TctB family protein n=1 Tax=Phaeobacter sp. CECT 5382 TaxID=1712645 RepID=UPI0006DBC218|nr:tripartite tricarboxylate transporter TctB family protein [Phaeobacter sp. CECT 5382]CUH88091.1 Tripartite tricarboxylate transporter TctB family protein [Phaeobacter sp. CECT 5382]
MALDRWIALIILMISLAYGYAAYFTMDGLLPPFMKFNPIWPSTFPKVLSVLAVLTAGVIVLGLEQPKAGDRTAQVPRQSVTERIFSGNWQQALGLLALMVAYALLIRPLGFLLATVGFISCGAALLGERKLHILIPVAAIAAGVVWYLVQGVLGIYLKPLPAGLGG